MNIYTYIDVVNLHKDQKDPSKTVAVLGSGIRMIFNFFPFCMYIYVSLE